MDKMQQQFEKVAKENGYDISKDEHDGFYKSDTTDNAWLFWRKSRAALVVELPPNRISTDVYMEDEVKASLDKAGIRYE